VSENVQYHGGSIEVQSEVGMEPDFDNNSAGFAPLGNMPKETILVVDDERLVRWSLQQKLEQWGYHVSLAEDGATALGRVQLDNPT